MIYIYIYTFRYSDFYVNFQVIFFQKELLKTHGGTYDQILGGGGVGGWGKMLFPIISKSINCKSFAQPCWDIHLKIKP